MMVLGRALHVMVLPHALRVLIGLFAYAWHVVVRVAGDARVEVRPS